ncbi:MAG: spore maturation protein [Clostridium sp.]|nr:spore maturation protein [Clostridium sp.]MCM1444227.1 spore maturation protein [Candidatus Amulumruptor caecigallinarius]
MSGFSNYIIPIMVLVIILYAILKKTNVYENFIDGAEESFGMTLKLFPSLLAMIFGVNIFLKSGILDFIFSYLEPLFSYINVQVEILPMAIMRPISGSSSLALLNDILLNHGPDSLIGSIASIIQGSTDTTFYVLTLYFGSIGIKKIKYAMWAGLFADVVGILTAIILGNVFFG